MLGELAFDGAMQPVSGVLPAAIAAVAAGRDLICPHDCGSEVAWAKGLSIIAPPGLTGLVNAHIGIDQLNQQIMMDNTAQDLLRTAIDQANLSARAYHKIMRVSRTIADLAGDEKAGRAALAEALDYLAMPLLALVGCLRSIASHVSAAISMPDKRWISRMPVGEVTLISVI